MVYLFLSIYQIHQSCINLLRHFFAQGPDQCVGCWLFNEILAFFLGLSKSLDLME